LHSAANTRKGEGDDRIYREEVGERALDVCR
jgi:hypothetical protein